jgi:putative transposase
MPNTYTNLLYHIVFGTKDRQPLIDSDWQPELFRYMGGIVRDEAGTLLAAGGVADHVHLLVKLKPTLAIATLMAKVKANSSRWVSDEKLHAKRFAWQEGYGALSVSESQVDAVMKYLANQEAHHRKMSFRDEFENLLVKHGIDFEPRYLP